MMHSSPKELVIVRDAITPCNYNLHNAIKQRMIQQNRKVVMLFNFTKYFALSFIIAYASLSIIIMPHIAQQTMAQTMTTTPMAYDSTTSKSFLTYQNNPTLGIKIQYPSNWKNQQVDGVGVVLCGRYLSNKSK